MIICWRRVTEQEGRHGRIVMGRMERYSGGRRENAAFFICGIFVNRICGAQVGGRLEKALRGFGRFGAVGGALLGCVPQCGFSAAAANLYAGRVITVGTLIAVFLSTSDEAIVVLLAHPGSIGIIGKLLLVKIIIAIAAGFIIDCFFIKPASDRDTQQHLKDLCTHCHCGEHNLFASALRHTLQIFLFIFLFSFVLNFLIAYIGEEQISRLLLQNSLLQPVIAGIFGMVPNCASSVILTELYLAGSLSFGATVAGLSAGAGVGLGSPV